MARDAYVLDEYKVVVFWSRKAGNTSLAEWLADIVTSESENRGPMRRRVKRAVPTADPQEALRLIRKEGFEDYVLARNPYRRLVSAYVEKFLFYGDRPMDSFDAIKAFARGAFLDAMKLQDRPCKPADYRQTYPGLSFAAFLEMIVEKVRFARRFGVEPELNGHWSPQVPLRFEREKFTYANVIKLEQISQQIEKLAWTIGAGHPFPHARRNETSDTRIVADEDLSKATSVELIGDRIIPAAGALLTEATIAMIDEAYAPDFAMLNYARDPAL